MDIVESELNKEEHVLGSLSGTSLSDQDHDLVVLHKIQKLLAMLVDGELATTSKDLAVFVAEGFVGEWVGFALLGSLSLLGGGGAHDKVGQGVVGSEAVGVLRRGGTSDETLARGEMCEVGVLLGRVLLA